MNNKHKVTCPICNWLLFNKQDGSKGQIEIKCTRCKNIVQIELNTTKSE